MFSSFLYIQSSRINDISNHCIMCLNMEQLPGSSPFDSDYGGSSACSSRASFTSCLPPNVESSLTSLLNEISVTDSDSLEQLDRENAHFVISESIMRAFEEIKWTMSESQVKETRRNSTSSSTTATALTPVKTTSLSDEAGKQLVRLRCPPPSINLTPSSSLPSLNEATGDDGEEEEVLSSCQTPVPLDQVNGIDMSSISGLHDKGFSLSNASLFSNSSDVTTYHQSVTSTSDIVDTSAEAIAYNLLRRFSISRQEGDHLEWMLPEESEEVPQKMLPLPSSTPISPDQVEDELSKSLSPVKLRGNFEWAPPRRQLVFSIHVGGGGGKNVKTQMALQNMRCAGCGCKIEPSYIGRMLYCCYTGKYYCQFGCHSNAKSVIPALVLAKWNFRKYPVSNFALQVIESLREEKLFDLQSLGFLPCLMKKSKNLSRVIELRSQLVSLRQYISTCKRGGNLLLLYLIFEPKHLVNVEAKDLYLFSLNDLIRIKSDTKLAESIAHIVKLSIRHVSSCSSCSAKGFFCDICSKSNESSRDIIFPFEVGRVASCPRCGTCFHAKCVQSNVNFSCSKCERRRQRTLAKSSLVPEDEEPSYQNSNASALESTLPVEDSDEMIESPVSSLSTINN